MIAANHWALVTGASSGIGAEFARQLAARGMHLILAARREELMQELAEELVERHGAKVVVIPADLAVSGGARALFDEVVRRDLEVSILVNNAGFGQIGVLEDRETERELSMIDLNIRALTELTYCFANRMKAAGSGGIINVASVAAFQPIAYMPVYSAGKAYVLHFSEALWAEMRDSGLHVMALCPGTTETEFFDKAGAGGWLQKHMSLTASKVVRSGIKGFDRRKPFVVTGWQNRLLTSLPRLAPRRLVALETRKYFRPKR